jgi:glycosyltransferase involved in cell wall biosynthesis/SAM-dependent methyltransferase
MSLHRPLAPPALSSSSAAAPDVSIVMIFLNAAAFIEQAIASIFDQTWDSWELLLVDDGSTDASTAIAREFARSDARVHYIEHENHANCGMGASRSLGVAHGRGSFFAFLDADDAWVPGKLEEQLRILEANPDAGLVFGSPLYWYSWTGNPADSARDHEPERGYPVDRVIPPPELLLLTSPLGSEPVPCPSDVLVRRETLLRVGSFEPLFRGAYEDVAFFSKVFLEEPVFASSRCWTRYRIHDQSCMAVAVADGGHGYQAARIRFLNWYEQYLAARGRRDSPAWSSLQARLEPYRLPLAGLAMRPDDSAPLRAVPNPVPAGSTTTRICWDTGDGSPGYLFVTQDSAGEAAFAEGASGEQDAAWINPGSIYEFRLYSDRERTRLLGAVTVGRVPDPGIGGESFGSLRRVVPLSRQFGFDRGQPIDRYYIDRFLAEHAADIHGRVLEIGESTYTRRFGGDRVARADVLHVEPGNPEATIVADLAAGEGIPDAAFDCVLLIQTLHLIFDFHAAVRTLERVLKPGGIVLATFPGLSQRSSDEWSNIWYWGFTSHSAARVFSAVFPAAEVSVGSCGNVLATSAFLYGLSAAELSATELDHVDDCYQTLVTVRARKPDPAGNR